MVLFFTTQNGHSHQLIEKELRFLLFYGTRIREMNIQLSRYNYVYSFIRKLPSVFIGDEHLGAFQMRGVKPAVMLGIPICPPWRAPRCDTAILIKSAGPFAKQIRKRCNRLIFDMLDAWMSNGNAGSKIGYEGPAEQYFLTTYEQIRFDILLLSTPAAVEVARSVLPMGVHVVYSPHHADESIESNWYDSTGPIVYVGATSYIQSRLPEIHGACEQIGKKLVVSSELQQLRGASLTLALRLPPYDTPINRLGKPQVKLENSAAAAIPVLASPHLSVLSCRPEVTTWNDQGTESFVDSLERALRSSPLRTPVTLSDHCNLIKSILGKIN